MNNNNLVFEPKPILAEMIVVHNDVNIDNFVRSRMKWNFLPKETLVAKIKIYAVKNIEDLDGQCG